MEITNNLEKGNIGDNFLNSTLWKTINNGLDIGLRYILPELIEDEVIELKDNLLNFGLKDGTKKYINSLIETGKQTLGIITGNFEDISQVQEVVKNEKIIDKISDLFDIAINKIQDNGIIDSKLSNTLKTGKNSILLNIEKNLDEAINNQISSNQKINKYINKWNEYYDIKDFYGMEKEYEKLEKELNKFVPLEKTLKKARYVENIHNLIKNNGQNFELTKEQKDLAEKF